MHRSELVGFAREKISTTASEETIALYRKRPPEPRMLASWHRTMCSNTNYLVIAHYLLGEDEAARGAAVRAVASAEEYFLGHWMSEAPSGNYGENPPDPEYWHQTTTNYTVFIESMCTASVAGRWDSVGRLAEHWATIRWREVMLGHLHWYEIPKSEDIAWMLALARLIRGMSPDDDDIKPLIEMIQSSKRRREKLLMDFTLAIFQGTDKQLRVAANLYFDYFRKVESKQTLITKKVMIEGTFLVNLARHRGQTLEVPESIGPRYIALQAS